MEETDCLLWSALALNEVAKHCRQVAWKWRNMEAELGGFFRRAV